MTTASVREFSKAWWSEVYNRIIGAVVFLDDASAECLHWDGGLFNLLSGGAVSVKSLSPFESAKKEHKKAVFITQTSSTQLQTVREIVHNSDFSHCILISAISLDVIYLELNEGRDVSDVVAAGRAPAEASKQLESMLLDWIGKKQSAVEVVHIPIFTISLTSDVFLTPPHCDIYPLFNNKMTPDTLNVDLYTLNNDERSKVRRLTSSLNSMFDSMNLKEDVYYMGTFSSLIAGVLENSPVCLSRRKNCSNPASLIIVDRTLDLGGVTSHASESILDKIMSVLPRFPGHSTDVAVDMSPVCEANVLSSAAEDIQLSPGCLYHEGDKSCLQTLDYMMNKSQKEVMFDLYNKLSNIDVQKSPGLKTLLKVTPQRIEKIVTACKGKYDIIQQHSGQLQQARAVVQMLRSPQYSQMELISNLEQQVLQSLAISREHTSVLKQISDLIRSRKERNLQLDHLLALLCHVYALAGSEIQFPPAHVTALQETLSLAFFEEHRSLLRGEGGVCTPEECEGRASAALTRLRELGRERLHRYNSVLKPSEAGGGFEYRGVLQQLVEDLVDNERPDMVDLKHRNDGIKDLLRSGLNILTKKSRGTKHPLDNPLVIIFVVGGVSAEECKRVLRTVATSGVDATVLVGSTKLATPTEAARDLGVL